MSVGDVFNSNFSNSMMKIFFLDGKFIKLYITTIICKEIYTFVGIATGKY